MIEEVNTFVTQMARKSIDRTICEALMKVYEKTELVVNKSHLGDKITITLKLKEEE